MVQAASTKGIDFELAEVRSRWWWIKLRWILDRIEENSIIDVLKLQHAQNIALLDYKTSQEALDKHWKAANSIVQDIYNLRFDWYKDSKESNKKNDINNLVDQWKKRYGDPKDPEVKAKIKRVSDRMLKRAADHKLKMKEQQLKKQDFEKGLKERLNKGKK